MTGKELIIYILRNNLEDEVIFQDGRIKGFVTMDQLAAKLGVCVETIKLWNAMCLIRGFMVGGVIFFPENTKHPSLSDIRDRMRGNYGRGEVKNPLTDSTSSYTKF